MRLERIQVITRDDYRGSQEPVAFCWRGRTFKVTAVVERWIEGRMDPTRRPLRYFRVVTDRDRQVLIRHHDWHGAWALCLPQELNE